MSPDVDLYRVLGVSPDAALQDLRAAYRRRAKQCHPDAGGSHRLMVELIAAWEVLSDPAKRALYDERRAGPVDAAAAASWEAARQDAEAAAEAKAEQYAGDWEGFVSWMDAAAGEVEASAGGRLASGAAAGLLVGVSLGALVGWAAGAGVAPGAVIGVVVGAAGGAWAAKTTG